MALTDSITAPAARKNGRDVGFAIGIVTILAVLFLPIPPFLIDVGLAFSIALSVLILMVALWIPRPLDFSSFPTILLVATMLRLSFNIATTRVILSEGHEGVNAAGYVIGGWSLPSTLPGAVGYLYLPALFTIAAAGCHAVVVAGLL